MNKHHTFKTGIFISIFLALILICLGIFTKLFFTSKTIKKDAISVALITNSADINDSSYNQCAYEGMKNYCENNNIKYTYYKPMDSTAESGLSSIDEAVKNGAELIICSDSDLSQTVYQAQDRYEDTYFILVNSEPVSSDGSVIKMEENVTSLLFDDDESGFLAGYSCVSLGYKNISVIYNSNTTSDMHYYYGFIQGANYSAKENNINITIGSRDICSASDDYIPKYAGKSYSTGTEIIFTCNNDICETVSSQAEKNGGLVMNAGNSMINLPCVAASITKNVSNAVYREVEAFFSGEFNGGTATTFNTSNDGLTLVLNKDLTKDFPQEKYDNVYTGLSDDSIMLISDTTMDLEDLNLSNVTIKRKKNR